MARQVLLSIMSERGSENGVGRRFPAERAARPRRRGPVRAACAAASAATVLPYLADLDARGLKRPQFVIVDGAPGLEAALVQLWGNDLPIQRCTVHVWMPPLMQGFSERSEHVIECGHV